MTLSLNGAKAKHIRIIIYFMRYYVIQFCAHTLSKMDKSHFKWDWLYEIDSVRIPDNRG